MLSGLTDEPRLKKPGGRLKDVAENVHVPGPLLVCTLNFGEGMEIDGRYFQRDR